jgi:palmitoyltransferase ZDHHC9/14/18
MGEGTRVLYDTTRFGGNNKFWLGGRSMTGPDLRGVMLTGIAIVITSVLTLGFAFPWLLVNRITIGAPLLAVFLVALATVLVSGWLTSTTDPGIIPRSPVPPQDMTRNASNPRERLIDVRDRRIRVKYCETCKIWRPPHASHCSTCNNCVERFDHHCPYISGCVGRRNYRSFLTFIISMGFLSATAISVVVLHLVFKVRKYSNRPNLQLAQAIREAITSGGSAVVFFIIPIALFGFVFSAGLTGFHLYLMWNNVTTAESFKKSDRNAFGREDNLRGPRAVLYLMTAKRPESRIVEGHVGLRYYGEDEIASAIEKQIEMENLAQRQPDSSLLSSVSTRVPSAKSRVSELSSGFAKSNANNV